MLGGADDVVEPVSAEIDPVEVVFSDFTESPDPTSIWVGMSSTMFIVIMQIAINVISFHSRMCVRKYVGSP